VDLVHIDDAEDMAGRAGLDQQSQVVGSVGTQGPGLEDKGRHGAMIIVAGKLGRAGVLDIKGSLNILEQTRLRVQDRPGIVIKIGIGMGPGDEGRAEEGRGDAERKQERTIFHINLDARG